MQGLGNEPPKKEKEEGWGRERKKSEEEEEGREGERFIGFNMIGIC